MNLPNWMSTKVDFFLFILSRRSFCFMVSSQESGVLYYIHTKYFQNTMFME